MKKNYLVEELGRLENLYDLALTAWMNYKGSKKANFRKNELEPLRVKLEEVRARIADGEDGKVDKEQELKDLENKYQAAYDKWLDINIETEKYMYELEILNPLKAKIYNLKKELNK